MTGPAHFDWGAHWRLMFARATTYPELVSILSRQSGALASYAAADQLAAAIYWLACEFSRRERELVDGVPTR